MSFRVQADLFQQRVQKQVSNVVAPIMRWYNRTRFDRISPVNKNIWINRDGITAGMAETGMNSSPSKDKFAVVTGPARSYLQRRSLTGLRSLGLS